MNMQVAKLNLQLRISVPSQNEWLYQLVNDQTIIGRDRTSQLHINDISVSRFHCAIRVVLDTAPWIRVEDLGSTNGTLINSKEICGEETLREHDLLEVGNVIIRLNHVGTRTRAIPIVQV